jgi:hypothetical protein
MTAPSLPAIDSSSAERGVRRILLATMFVGAIGIGCDLLLLAHIEDPLQLLPLAALALLVLLLFMHVMLQRPFILRAVQVLMLGFLAVGGLGVWFHFDGNAEFQRDIQPSIGGSELFWKSMRAKAPPALAPLAFVQLALVGWAWSFRHPLLRAKQRT